MLMKEVSAIAKKYGIKTGKLTKSDLIRAIQLHEGNFDCFGSAIDGYCDQYGCFWREDCLTPEQSSPAKKKAPVKKAAAPRKPAAPKKKTVAKKKAAAKKK
jgi:hypothetical protein